jgi:hypothetical protein
VIYTAPASSKEHQALLARNSQAGDKPPTGRSRGESTPEIMDAGPTAGGRAAIEG